MQFSDNPAIIEYRDIVGVEYLKYDKEAKRLTAVFALRTDEEYFPEALFLTDGTQNRVFYPELFVSPTPEGSGDPLQVQGTIFSSTTMTPIVPENAVEAPKTDEAVNELSEDEKSSEGSENNENKEDVLQFKKGNGGK